MSDSHKKHFPPAAKTHDSRLKARGDLLDHMRHVDPFLHGGQEKEDSSLPYLWEAKDEHAPRALRLLLAAAFRVARGRRHFFLSLERTPERTITRNEVREEKKGVQ